ncbi:3'-5' exonuclease [Betaproteobacteria bacterium]|nr:3'-5' exonuclease [Betaproteobacteria bacterium]GHU22388.1 3'-5' exonuclease [Betaproteobacteria bacterium]
MWRIFTPFRKRRILPQYRGIFEQDDGQLVSIDCETTSLDVAEAELLSIAAVKIDGNRITASTAFQTIVQPKTAPNSDNVRIHGLRPADVSAGLSPTSAVRKLLDFIGGRTLLGYYLEYDIAVLNKYIKPLIGAPLPNMEIELSSRYYDWRQHLYPGSYIDLRWEIMAQRLNISALPRHDAMNDAITVGMMYLALEERFRRPGSNHLF